MGVIETFSKRQRKLKGEMVDVFTYDQLPIGLRVQICHILVDCLGEPKRDYLGSNPSYKYLHKAISTEFGMFNLPGLFTGGPAKAVIDFFTNDATTEQALDIIDIAFRYLALAHRRRQQWLETFQSQMSDEEGVSDLNARFLEHGVGYTFLNDGSPQLIRRDNEHLHSEAVLPALKLLHEEGFEGANAEYRKAHEHYRQGHQKECLNECLKAFESTMKTICSRKKWAYRPTDTASSLIDSCLKNGLLPSFMQAHLGAVRSALESAIPTVRNKLSGHGQGERQTEVPQFYAEYLLHETAATIVFLMSAYKALG